MDKLARLNDLQNQKKQITDEIQTLTDEILAEMNAHKRPRKKKQEQ
jgi:hypothetical protein